LKVYTYFQQVDKLKLGKKPWHLVEYWVSHWKSRGWEPAVLTIEDAKKHPYFPEYFKWIKKVKTVNPFEYEAACFLRHLAMSVVGGGLMTDTDVFNLTLQPGGFAGHGPDPRSWRWSSLCGLGQCRRV
jgi:hypothetical protein